MKPSATYRKAAEVCDANSAEVEIGPVSACNCIAFVAPDSDSELIGKFEDLFEPDLGHAWVLNWGELWGDTAQDFRQRKACRVLALLFMAAICESEGR